MRESSASESPAERPDLADRAPSAAAPRAEPRSASPRPAAAARRPVLWPTPESRDPNGRAAELRRDWQARLKPIDEAERAAVDAIVGTIRRRALLERAELRVLEGLAEGRVEPSMPSLATLARHAARIEKDRALAERELRELYALRPQPIPRPDLNPERLEWLAAHLRRRAGETAEAQAAELAARQAAAAAASVAVPQAAKSAAGGAVRAAASAGSGPAPAGASGRPAAAPGPSDTPFGPWPAATSGPPSPTRVRRADWLASASALAHRAAATGAGGG